MRVIKVESEGHLWKRVERALLELERAVMTLRGRRIRVFGFVVDFDGNLGSGLGRGAAPAGVNPGGRDAVPTRWREETR